MPYVLTVPYTPEYMSVEYVWAKMKYSFRKILTEMKIKNHDRFDMFKLLKKVRRTITEEDIVNSGANAFRKIFKENLTG